MTMKFCFFSVFLCSHSLWADPTKDLFDAIEKQDVVLVEEALIKGANVHERNILEKTPLHEAAHSFSPAIPLLLKAGARLEVGDEDDWTPLTFAALCNKHSVPLLLMAGANVNHIDKDKMTPLDHAKDLEVIDLLKKNGALTLSELESLKSEGGNSQNSL